jgi:hypothetical protein
MNGGGMVIILSMGIDTKCLANVARLMFHDGDGSSG